MVAFLQQVENFSGLKRGYSSLQAQVEGADEHGSSCGVDNSTQAVLLEELNPIQKTFVEDNTTRLLALIGGFGSGKTRSLCSKSLFNILQQPGLDGMVVMGTMGEFEEIWDPSFLPMVEMFHFKLVRYQRAPSRIITIEAFGLLSKIYCFSGDNG